MGEIWKDIEGYEGLYQISSIGRIKALSKKVGRGRQYQVAEKILKPQITPNGYLRLHLNKDGKRKYYSVHRLVAIAFIHNPNNYPQINHKDENKTNNNVINLEWCTPEYNANYGTRNDKICHSKMGHIVTQETRNKLRLKNLGSNSSLYGTRRSEETRQKISESLKKYHLAKR